LPICCGLIFYFVTTDTDKISSGALDKAYSALQYKIALIAVQNKLLQHMDRSTYKYDTSLPLLQNVLKTDCDGWQLRSNTYCVPAGPANPAKPAGQNWREK